MGRIDRQKKRFISFLLAAALISGLLTGCSSSKSVSAKVDQKLELAIKYLSEQKYEEAILAYQEVIKIDSKNITAYKGISLAYVLQEKPDKAEQAIQEALKAVPQNTQLQLAIAGLMVDRGKGDQAEAIYKELLNKENPSVSLYQAYTYYLNQAGKQAEAIALLENGAAKNAQAYQLNSMLAELYLKTGDKEKALAAINKSMNIEPNRSAAYKQLAELYKDKWAELIALGDQYIQQNQAKTGALYKLAGLYGLKQYAELIKEYEKLSTEIKDNPRLRLLIAQTYAQLGNQDKSKQLIKTIKLADIKDAGMLADLANYYLESGDKDNARKIALQGITADDTSIDNYVVMFKSYAGEDKNLAQIWALKYLLASVLSYDEGLSQLADYGLVLGSLKQSEDELTSKEIVESMVVDQANAEKILKSHNADWPHINTYIYMDTKNNIAYKGYSEKASNWKPIIIRYHSPAIYNKENIPADVIDHMNKNYSGGWSQYLSENKGYTKYILTSGGTLSGKSDWAYPVVIEGDIPFEEHIKRAGYPIEDITFIDR